MFAASEIETSLLDRGMSRTTSGIIGGMGGGIAQAYATMGFCTFMKTVEVTRHKEVGSAPQSTYSVAREIYRKEGIRGINKVTGTISLMDRESMRSLYDSAQIGEVDSGCHESPRIS
jgi:hypothetical protein